MVRRSWASRTLRRMTADKMERGVSGDGWTGSAIRAETGQGERADRLRGLLGWVVGEEGGTGCAKCVVGEARVHAERV